MKKRKLRGKTFVRSVSILLALLLLAEQPVTVLAQEMVMPATAQPADDGEDKDSGREEEKEPGGEDSGENPGQETEEDTGEEAGKGSEEQSSDQGTEENADEDPDAVSEDENEESDEEEAESEDATEEEADEEENTVLAEEEPERSALTSYEGTVEVSTFEDLKVALEADATNTVKMTKSITFKYPGVGKGESIQYHGAIEVRKGKHVLDLNGNRLEFRCASADTKNDLIPFYMNNEEFTICDTSETKRGRIEYKIGAKDFSGYYPVIDASGVKLTLRDIDFTVDGGDALEGVQLSSGVLYMENCKVGAYGKGVNVTNSDVTLKNCEITSYKGTAVCADATSLSNTCTLTIEGGTYQGQADSNCNAVAVKRVNLKITGGNFKSTWGSALQVEGGKTVIEGGSFTTSSDYEAVDAGEISGEGADFSFKLYGAELQSGKKRVLWIYSKGLSEEGLLPYIPASSSVTVGGKAVSRETLGENYYLETENDGDICIITDNRNDPVYQITDVAVRMENVSGNLYALENIATVQAPTTTEAVKVDSLTWEEYILGESTRRVTEGAPRSHYDYKATVKLTSDTKYFMEDVDRTVTVNGIETQNYYVKDDALYVEVWYDSPRKIQKARLTVNAPVAGEALPVNAMTTSEGIQGDAIEMSWDSADKTAQEGKIYYATVRIKTAGDYYYTLQDQLTIAVNEENEAWKPLSVETVRENSNSVYVIVGFRTIGQYAIHVDGGVALNSRGEIIEQARPGEVVILSPEVPEGKGFSTWSGLEEITPAGNYTQMQKQFFAYYSNPRFYMPAREMNISADLKDEGSDYIRRVSVDLGDLCIGEELPTSGKTGDGYAVSLMKWETVDAYGNRSEVSGSRAVAGQEYVATCYLSKQGSKNLVDNGTIIDMAGTLAGTVNGQPIMGCGKVVKNGAVYAFVRGYVGKASYGLKAADGAEITNENGEVITVSDAGEQICLSAPEQKDGKKFQYWDLRLKKNEAEIIDPSKIRYVDGYTNKDASTRIYMPEEGIYAIPVYAADSELIRELHISGLKAPEKGKSMPAGTIKADQGMLQSMWGILETRNPLPETGVIDQEAFRELAENTEMIEDADYQAKYGERYIAFCVVLPGSGKTFPADASEMTVSTEGREDAVYYLASGILYVIYDFGTLAPEGLWMEEVEEQVYTGAPVKPQIRAYCDGVYLKEGEDYSISYKNNTKAAASTAKNAPTITIKGKKSYKGSYQSTFTIKPAEFGVTPGITADDLVVVGDGKRQIKGKPVVKYNGKAVPAAEYTLEYEGYDSDKNKFCVPGIYTIHIKGKGNNFTGEMTVQQTVAGKLTAKNVTGSIANRTFTGKPIEPSVAPLGECKVVGADGKTALTKYTDYQVSYLNNVNKGTATVVIKGVGVWTGEVKKTFKIEPAAIAEVRPDKTVDIKVKVTNAPDEEAYVMGGVKPQGYLLTYNGVILKEGTDYTVTHRNNTRTALKTDTKAPCMQIAGKGNYKGSFALTYTIKAADLVKGAELTAPDVLYKAGKNNCVTKFVLRDRNGKVLKAGVDYAKEVQYAYRDGSSYTPVTDQQITLADGENEKEMQITVTGKGNYAGTIQATYRIYCVQATQFKVEKIADQEYCGEAIELTPAELQVKDSKTGVVLSAGTDYDVSYEKNQNAGTATVILTGKGAYGGVLRKTFKIKPVVLATQQKDGTQTIHADIYQEQMPADRTYDRTAQKPEDVKLRYKGTLLEKGRDYTLSYKNNTKAAGKTGGGNLAKAPVVIVTGKGNYAGKLMMYFSILQSSLDEKAAFTVTAADVLYKDAKNNYVTKFTVTDARGKKLTAGTDYEKQPVYEVQNDDMTWSVLAKDEKISLSGSSKERIVRITVKGKGNYLGEITQKYRVYSTAISKANVAKIADEIYTSKQICPKPVVTIGADKTALTEGVDYTLTYQNNVKVGKATIIIKGIGSYGGEKKVTFRITSHELTWWEKLTTSLTSLFE